MTDAPSAGRLGLFLAAAPGLEPQLLAEARGLGLGDARAVPGGVEATGDWTAVWRANLRSRVAGRVLVRVGAFRALHLAQLDKRARRLPWSDFLRPDVPVRVEATSRRSRVWHAGAAAQRVARAVREVAGATEGGADALLLTVRLDDDLCAVSVDSSGAPLHRRGFKQEVGKAPLRETMAAAFLAACGWRGETPLVDPMCGSGAFAIEAAEIALGLAPGRARAFAFERLATFDASAWAALRDKRETRPGPPPVILGMDRDAGAVAAARANAQRAGVDAVATFAVQPVSALAPPPAVAPGLVIANPPYGARLGEVGDLRALYAAFGRVLRERFAGWRAALVTSEPELARAAGLPFASEGPWVPHGPLRVRLYATDPLP